jgi:sporulation protein YlmC with PRC-barrel domain
MEDEEFGYKVGDVVDVSFTFKEGKILKLSPSVSIEFQWKHSKRKIVISMQDIVPRNPKKKDVA